MTTQILQRSIALSQKQIKHACTLSIISTTCKPQKIIIALKDKAQASTYAITCAPIKRLTPLTFALAHKNLWCHQALPPLPEKNK